MQRQQGSASDTFLDLSQERKVDGSVAAGICAHGSHGGCIGSDDCLQQKEVSPEHMLLHASFHTTRAQLVVWPCSSADSQGGMRNRKEDVQ